MLNISRAARDDLRSLFWNGIDMFGPVQADRYIEGLLETLDRIADFPHIGIQRPEFGPTVRVHAHRSHVIVYRTEESGDVFIQRIRHGLEDWQARPGLDDDQV
jgi:toxin ParE1/3/4